MIGTHDGCFHCDEVFAVYMLKQLPQFKDHAVVRTRDMDVLDECDVVVDVGGVYSPERLRFDHHQKDFDVTWSTLFDLRSWSVKLSSAGLVYAHFGKQLLELLTSYTSEVVIERLFHKIYESFVLEIDGVDNGVAKTQAKLKYSVRTGICARVSRFNQWWNDELTKDADSLFLEAVQYVGREFADTVNYYANCWWPAREIICRAMATRELVDPSRMIILLEKSCPWRGHLSEVEREVRANTVLFPQPPNLCSHRAEPNYPPQVLFVVHPADDGTWICRSVTKDNYEKRSGLPASWCCLRDEELCEMSGISGCIFVHGSGHLGINETREGALQMAKSVVREMEAKELAHSIAHLAPPTFSRGRGHHHSKRGTPRA